MEMAPPPRRNTAREKPLRVPPQQLTRTLERPRLFHHVLPGALAAGSASTSIGEWRHLGLLRVG